MSSRVHPISIGETNGKEKKPCISPETNKRLTICMGWTGIILGLVTLIMAVLAYSKLASFHGDFNNILDTWKATPISEVIIVNGTCPSTHVAIHETTWKGTHPLCDCGCCWDVNCTAAIYTTRTCDAEELSFGCFDVPSTPEVTTSLFPDQSVSLCYKRNGISAMNRPVYSGGCGAGYVACGDSSTFQFCALSTIGCPVTDFLITSDNYSTEADEVTYAYTYDSTIYQLYVKKGGVFTIPTADRSPVSSLGSTGFPLVDAQVALGAPCYLHPTKNGYSGRKTEYDAMMYDYSVYNPYNDTYNYGFYWGYYSSSTYWCETSAFGYQLKSIPEGCKKKGYDTRYTSAYSVLEKYVYGNATDIPDQFITLSDEFVFSIVFQPEVYWKESETSGCPTRDTVIDNEGELAKLLSAQLALLVLTIVSFITVTVVGTCMYMKYVSKDNDGKIEKGEKNYYKVLALKVVKYLFKFAMYACTITTIIFATKTLVLFEQVEEDIACTDTLSYHTFNVLGTIVRDLSFHDMITGALNSVDAIGDIVLEVIQSMFG